MTDTTTSARSTGSTARRTDPRLWAGIGFVVVFMVGLVVGLATISSTAAPATTRGGWPAPTASPDQVVAFFTSSREAIALIGFTQVLSAIPLAVFSAGLARTFGGRSAPQLIAAGTLAAGTLMLSGVLTSVLSHPSLTGQPALTSVLAYLVFLVGGPAHVLALALLVLTTAVAGRLSGRLPVWLSTFGFVVAAIGLVASLNVAVPALPSLAVAAFIPAGRFLGFVFIVAAVLALSRSRAKLSAR